jgi:hypothetical protein
MRTRRTKDQIRKDNYNKDVDAYNFYVVNLDTKRAETGFQFREDAVDLLNDYDDKKKYKVVSKKALKTMGIENPNESFKYEAGGDFQSGVYAKGGSLEAHGIEVGDTFLTTISGVIQKVKDKNGNIVFINLANGERDSQPPLPFNKGGAVRNERLHVNKGEDYEVRYSKPRPSRKGYKGLRSFDEGGDLFEDYKRQPKKLSEIVNFYMDKFNEGDYDYQDSKNFLKEVEAIGYTFDYGLDNEPYGLRPIGTKFKQYATGGDLITETADSIFYANAKNGKIKTSFGDKTKEGLLNMLTNVNYDRNEIVDAIFDANEKNGKINTGFGTKTKEGLSQMIKNMQNTFATGGGVGLIGKQNRIDMNKNGKIDAEDFKLLRSSMNGAWRNERKHVNHNEDYEVRYARKKPARTGYKGKRKFADGGGISNFEIGDNVTIIKAFPNADMTGKKGKVVELTKNNTGVIYISVDGKRMAVLPEYISKSKKFAEGGGISNFERLSRVVAKNYEGKRVKPQYQKEYGKVYSKSEAKEVGDKVAGKVKANQKMATGGETKKGGKGGIMVLAKQIRKEGESWQDALKRAGQQLK